MNGPIKDGGPAFPIKGYCADGTGALCGEVIVNSGMTLRDYVAIHTDMGKVDPLDMQAAVRIMGRPMPTDPDGSDKWQFELVWRIRFMSADAMLRAREVQS